MSVHGLARRLPVPAVLARWSQSLAVLDAVLSPEWHERYFSFYPGWTEGEQVASMRNGMGDEYSISFTRVGTLLRAFDHEPDLSSWAEEPPAIDQGLLAGLPQALRAAVDEPAFADDGVPRLSLALWRLPGDAAWSHGAATRPVSHPDDDGGTFLFDQLDGRADTYAAFMADYHEVPADLPAITHVLAHRPLTEAVVRALNPDRNVQDLDDELATIGYPAQ